MRTNSRRARRRQEQTTQVQERRQENTTSSLLSLNKSHQEQEITVHISSAGHRREHVELLGQDKSVKVEGNVRGNIHLRSLACSLPPSHLRCPHPTRLLPLRPHQCWEAVSSPGGTEKN